MRWKEIGKDSGCIGVGEYSWIRRTEARLRWSFGTRLHMVGSRCLEDLRVSEDPAIFSNGLMQVGFHLS